MMNAQCVAVPIVERAAVFEFERADAVSDAFE